MTELLCTMCGQVMRNAVLDIGGPLLAPQQRQILKLVMDHPGLSAWQLANVFFADHPDGGPLTANEGMRVRIAQMNVVLRQHGFEISGAAKRGYHLQHCKPVVTLTEI